MSDQQYEIVKSITKGELYAVHVGGKVVGNFRRTDKGFRQGVGENATFHSLDLSVEDVAKIIAEAHHAEREAKANAKAEKKKAALEAKANRQNEDGNAKAKKPTKARTRRTKKVEDAELPLDA
jgi:hypothetical protein